MVRCIYLSLFINLVLSCYGMMTPACLKRWMDPLNSLPWVQNGGLDILCFTENILKCVMIMVTYRYSMKRLD